METEPPLPLNTLNSSDDLGDSHEQPPALNHQSSSIKSRMPFVEIRIQHWDGTSIAVAAHRTAHMETFLRKFCKDKDAIYEQTLFFFKGELFEESETVEGLGLCHGDVIMAREKKSSSPVTTKSKDQPDQTLQRRRGRNKGGKGEQVTVCFEHWDGKKIYTSMMTNVSFEGVLANYKERFKVQNDHVRFVYNNMVVCNDTTPYEIAYKEGDVIRGKSPFA